MELKYQREFTTILIFQQLKEKMHTKVIISRIAYG